MWRTEKKNGNIVEFLMCAICDQRLRFHGGPAVTFKKNQQLGEQLLSPNARAHAHAHAAHVS
jgi:hypothetical protein